jgi:hypothetical protein
MLRCLLFLQRTLSSSANLKPPSYVQFGLRRFNPAHWKRIWIIYYHLEKEKPPRVGGLLFPATTRIQLLNDPGSGKGIRLVGQV